MDEPIGSSSCIRIAHATHSTVCTETGRDIGRGDICVKLWGHPFKTRNGRSVRYLSVAGADTLEQRLQQGGVNDVSALNRGTIEPETTQFRQCGVCQRGPARTDDPIPVYMFGSKPRYFWMHEGCLGQFAEELGNIWEYADVAIENHL